MCLETHHPATILCTQQTSPYLLDKEHNPNPRELFISDLLSLIENVVNDDQDIILLGDFNKTFGDDITMVAKILTSGRLTDVHVYKHGQSNIAT